MNLDRFLSRTTPAGRCLLWTGARNNCGYGVLRFGGRLTLAHRVSYLLHRGPIPDGLVLRHACDVRNCVAPWHLEPGTQSQNVAESWARTRLPWRTARELRALDDAFIAATTT